MTLRGMTVLAPAPSKAPRIKMIFFKELTYRINSSWCVLKPDFFLHFLPR